MTRASLDHPITSSLVPERQVSHSGKAPRVWWVNVYEDEQHLECEALYPHSTRLGALRAAHRSMQGGSPPVVYRLKITEKEPRA